MFGFFIASPYAGSDGQPPLGLFYGGGIGSFANQLVSVAAIGSFVFILTWITG